MNTTILTCRILFISLLTFPIFGLSQNVGLNRLNDCDTVYGIRLGLTEKEFSDACSSVTNGIRLELFGNSLQNDSDDYHPDPILIDDLRFQEPVDTFDILNGINFSLLGSRSALNINGLSISIISQKTATINGLQVSSISNIAQGRNNGVQASTVKNVSIMNNGLQVSVTNFSIAINGLQIGIFNDGIELYGVQLGLVNRVNHSEGLQIGLWNISNLGKFPLIKF